MMMSKRCRHLLTLLLVFSLVNFPFITLSETPCAYPCYPPPLGGGGSTQPAGYYPQPTGYYPPSTGYYYPPPTGNVPNYPSPPYDGGDYGGGYYGTPPPPDPILPYFPFYYRKPPHQTDQSSSSASVKSTVKIVTMANIFAVLACVTS
ncbi:hypothetical protein N665_1352s0003 [Sinapis alba]|nr:hypothetical protein N665_1352s0003 [Sinapis alba]